MNSDRGPHFSGRTSLVLAAGFLIFVLIVAFAWMSRGYGEISEQGYAIGKALFSACNRRDEESVDKISQLVEQSLDDGSLSENEANWLANIVSLAKQQQWDRAQSEVRELLEDQITVANDLPQLD